MGLLGVRAQNGLIPQAPIHTRALLVHGLPPKATNDEEIRGADEQSREVPVAVIKQRVSNLVQGSLCLVLLTKQFLHATNLSPQGWYTFSSALLYADMPRTRRDRSPLVRGGTANLSAGLMMLLLLKLVYGPQWAFGEHRAEDPLFPHDAHTVDQPAP